MNHGARNSRHQQGRRDDRFGDEGRPAWPGGQTHGGVADDRDNWRGGETAQHRPFEHRGAEPSARDRDRGWSGDAGSRHTWSGSDEGMGDNRFAGRSATFGRSRDGAVGSRGGSERSFEGDDFRSSSQSGNWRGGNFTGGYPEEPWRSMSANEGGRERDGGIGGSVERSRQAAPRGKAPRGYRRSDERIREEICENVMDVADIDASDVQIDVTQGEVRLAGTLGCRKAKLRIEEIAESISGVTDVDNQIKVKRMSGAASDRGASDESESLEGAHPSTSANRSASGESSSSFGSGASARGGNAARTAGEAASTQPAGSGKRN